MPAQVAAPKGVLGPGELVGTGSGPGPAVGAVQVSAGQGLPAATGTGSSVTLLALILDRGFARQNALPDGGMRRTAGGIRVRYTGIGQSPEYFMGAECRPAAGWRSWSSPCRAVLPRVSGPMVPVEG